MAEEKILDSEKLDEDQLENVVGGTRAETRELSIALNQALYGIDFSGLNVNDAEHMKYAKSDLQPELERIGITAKLDIGVNGTGIGEQANRYFYKGVEIPHDKLVSIINSVNK